MKKLLLLSTIFLFSFKTNEEKTATVKLTASQWSLIYQVIEQSNAPHQQVKLVEQWILEQVQKQLSDSSNKK